VPNPRIPKLADQIGQLVARMLQTKVKDPRLGFVTITDVHLSGDAREASVFYTELAGDLSAESEIATALALESAKGLIRSTVGKRLGLKFAPTIAFVRDATAQSAKDMEELLARAQAADAELAASRDETKYAAGADPYRHDDAADDIAADAAVAGVGVGVAGVGVGVVGGDSVIADMGAGAVAGVGVAGVGADVVGADVAGGDSVIAGADMGNTVVESTGDTADCGGIDSQIVCFPVDPPFGDSEPRYAGGR
jgi:ribosome-binding factor A